nr:uncharacterized protein LOC117276198 [Nicotiana tomentosiformis]
MHLQSPIQEANVIQQGEDCDEYFSGEPVDFINVADLDNDSRSGKREITLDFELPEKFSQIFKFGEVNEDETTLSIKEEQGFLENIIYPPFSLISDLVEALLLDLLPIFNIIHPFTGVIGDDVDPDLLEEFNKWLYLGIDTVSKRCGAAKAAVPSQKQEKGARREDHRCGSLDTLGQPHMRFKCAKARSQKWLKDRMCEVLLSEAVSQKRGITAEVVVTDATI